MREGERAMSERERERERDVRERERERDVRIVSIRLSLQTMKLSYLKYSNFTPSLLRNIK